MPASGFSTLVAEEADRARRRGWDVHPSTVQVRQLADVLDEHLADGPLHALKVDVAGSEAEVLRGAGLARHRPWVVVVNATEPGSSRRTQHLWEPLLTELGYTPALFDGLNGWYVSPDHPELLDRLGYPACPGDGWVRAGTGFPDVVPAGADDVLSASALHLAAALAGRQAAEAVAAAAAGEAKKVREDLLEERATARERAAELERAVAQQSSRVDEMLQSTSWRLTRPVRAVASLARGRRRPSP